jgi:hypothetical protein
MTTIKVYLARHPWAGPQEYHIWRMFEYLIRDCSSVLSYMGASLPGLVPLENGSRILRWLGIFQHARHGCVNLRIDPLRAREHPELDDRPTVNHFQHNASS